MRRTEKIADVERLINAFNADPEITAHQMI
jgi:hypothetical protein